MPFAQLPVLSGQLLGSRLQLADVNLQLFGVVPGDLQLPIRLLGLGARVLTRKSQRISCNLESLSFFNLLNPNFCKRSSRADGKKLIYLYDLLKGQGQTEHHGSLRWNHLLVNSVVEMGHLQGSDG